jgi:glycine/D-amino acid oxidase-like deaminating enzyme
MAGLASAFYLLETRLVRSIEIFDSNPPGVCKNASSCAVLMHPFSPRGTIIWQGLEGMEETLALLRHSDSQVGGVFEGKKSILRPCFSQRAYRDWQQAASNYPQWFCMQSREQVESTLGMSPSFHQGGHQRVLGGVLYDDAVFVDAPKYLTGLWASVKALSAQVGAKVAWVQQDLSSVQSLLTMDEEGKLDAGCDAVVLANGAGCNALWKSAAPGTEDLPFMYVRGQTLSVPLKVDTRRSYAGGAPAAVLSAEFPGYVVPLNDMLVCGATHEYGELSDLQRMAPDLDQAVMRLRSKLDVIYPHLPWELAQSATAGIRVSTQRCHLGRLPVIGRHARNSKVWLISGFGSKGLVYHALLARHLAAAVVHGSPVPEDMRL